MVLIWNTPEMENNNIELLEDNYRNIFELLCDIKLSNEQLELIKSKFKCYINSPRRYDNIRDMKELLKVLEKRCLIGYDNIVKLYDIVERVDEPYKTKLGEHLNTQSYWLSKTPPAPAELAFFEDSEVCVGFNEFSLPIEVTGYISEHVRTYWKNFAKALQIIKEKEIDMIEDYNGNKTEKCLEIFIQEANRRGVSNPYSTLFSALEVIQRRDIKEHVENLLNSIIRRY